MVHVRFEGRSIDMDELEAQVNQQMGDREIKESIARKLDVAPERLRFYVVDRTPNGNVVIRPEAVYG
jgi:hypothetical protein